jgi:hypothetical protein
MTTMLRTQGIPARLAVGYTPGEQVGDDEWIVRGYNAHVWVEVHVPEHGWVEFDPTPTGPRLAAEQQALANATGAEFDSRNMDRVAADSATTETPGTDSDRTATDTATPSVVGGEDADGASLPSIPIPTPIPSGEWLGRVLITIAAVAATSYRSGIGTRLYRELWLRWLPDGNPDAVAVGAYRRAVYLESRRRRSREPAETPRQFLAGEDARLQLIAEGYERARYGDGIDAATATKLRAALAEVLEERSRAPHLLEKPGTRSR